MPSRLDSGILTKKSTHSPRKGCRAQHRTRPPTIWFCAATSDGRILKIVGIPLKDTREFVLKSAYEAEDWEIGLYEENQ